MTSLNTPARRAATGAGDQSQPPATLTALCVTQITSWGIAYHACPVHNPQVTAATGWPTSRTTAAFSLGLVISAPAGIPVGRTLNHRGPRTVMTVTQALGISEQDWAHARDLVPDRGATAVRDQ